MSPPSVNWPGSHIEDSTLTENTSLPAWTKPSQACWSLTWTPIARKEVAQTTSTSRFLHKGMNTLHHSPYFLHQKTKQTLHLLPITKAP